HFSHLDRSGHFDHEGSDGRDGHKNYHRDSRHENYDFESCEDLDLLFRSCAHMLHHKDQRSGSREQILTYLMENGSVYQKDIQKELRIQPGSVSELLSKLEKHDLIVRKKSRLDKRAVIISLTEKGAAEMKVRMQEETDSPFDRLTDEEQEALRNILRKLLSSEN
ncbi:MAG: MarR family transcriptional regulator, partial [Lachnospiraceae bacterium]|nr:MarR family transcriptional regulator [Lachnospiraceae bacterium]